VNRALRHGVLSATGLRTTRRLSQVFIVDMPLASMAHPPDLPGGEDKTEGLYQLHRVRSTVRALGR